MKKYRNLPSTCKGDYGGVYINSDIPNHAFYLVAINLGGNSWDKAGKICYQALCDPSLIQANSQFTDLQIATITKAEKIFGTNSNEAKVVKKASTDVGL